MTEKVKEKKTVEDIPVEDIPEELLKTKHGIYAYANRPKDKEANSENAPDEI